MDNGKAYVQILNTCGNRNKKNFSWLLYYLHIIYTEETIVGNQNNRILDVKVYIF